MLFLRPFLAALAGLLLIGAAQAAELRTVDWTATQEGALPPANASWQTFEIPLRWSAAPADPLRTVALRMKFVTNPVPKDAWAVLLAHAPNGGRISVNGRMVGQIQMADADTHVRWRRPHLVAIDPVLLTAGENELLVQTAYRGGTHMLAGVHAGPLTEVGQRYERQFFLSTTMPWIGATLAASLALIFGLLLLRRRDATIALVSIAALFWVARSVFFLMETVSLDWKLALDAWYFAASGGFAATITIVLMRIGGRTAARHVWIPIANGLLGPLALLLTGGLAAPYLDQLWMPTLVGMVFIALMYAIFSKERRSEPLQVLVVTGVTIGIAAAMHDYGVTQGWLQDAGTLMLHWAGPVLLLSLGAPVVDRFVRVLRAAEGARDELETRVKEREQMLKRNYERLRDGERLQATAAERQRIMQDMHDGLGTQLVSSLMLVERGALTQAQVAQVLRESIDDMRLAIDALAQGNSDLLASLGNLRYRMEPRFRAAGMELIWDARGMPEELNISRDAVLPILRIVQESLTNALKHSEARAVSVGMEVRMLADGSWLQIRITDNGKGISGERVGGRGLLNMRSRAGKLGAELTLESVPGSGTRVRLDYKVEPGQTAMTRTQTQFGLNTEAIIERFRQRDEAS